MVWKYEPDEKPKRKHAWDKPHAGFVEVGATLVAKCPNNISMNAAEAAINSSQAVHWSPLGWDKEFPKRIYIVNDGIVFRATPTVPGISYHAFPELPERFRDLPSQIQSRIFASATAIGCGDEVRRWADR
jgi:hypothetical protein